MKPFVVQTALPTSNTTFDFTDPIVASDWKGAIFFGTEATANDTTGATGAFYFGATDGARNVAIATALRDAQTSTNARTATYISNTDCISRFNIGGGNINLKGAYSSTLANGVRCVLTANDATAHLVNCLGFAGADVEFAVSSVSFTNSETTKSVTHNLSGAPDVVILAAANGYPSFGSIGEARLTLGFWDGANAAGLGFNQTTQVTPTTLAARVSADLGHSIVGLADHGTWSLANIGASTFDCNRSATGGDTACVIFIAIRAVAAVANKKAFLTTLPTGAGSAAIVSGMTGKPQVLMMVPTRLLNTSLQTDDTTGSIGFCAAVNNNGITQQASVAAVSQDGVSPSVAKHRTSQSAALLSLNTSPGVQNAATLASWDSGGATLNHSTVGASAFQAIGLAFGVQASASASVTVDTGALGFAGSSLDADIGVPWDEGGLKFTGQDIVLNQTGTSFQATIDSGQLSLTGQAILLDQGINSATATLQFAGQDIGFSTNAVIPGPVQQSVWAGDIAVQKSWQYLAGLGYCAALRMKTASSGIQLNLSAIDYLFKPGGVL